VRATRRSLISLAGALLLCVLALPPAALADFAPAKGQHLTINIGTYPSTFDPSKAADEHDYVVQNALFAPLYRSPGGANGRLVPFLAAGAPVVSNGGRRYTVRLRAARWSNGTPITAADVKLAVTRGRGSYLGSFFDGVVVSTVGLRTVRFDMETPRPWLDQLLATNVVTPVPSAQIKRYGKRWTQQKQLVSSGPFVMTNHRGAYDISLAPNPRWWGARRVRLRKLTLVAVPPATAGTLFNATRIDATTRDTSILGSSLATRLKDPRMRTAASASAQYLYMNTTAPTLQNADVRRGIALAIDRAALTQLTSDGIDRPLSSIVPTGVRGSAVAAPAGSGLLAASGAADPARAKEELATGHFDATQRLDLWYAQDSSSSAVAGAIVANLKAVGVTVTPHPVSATELSKVGVGLSPVRSDVELVLQGWLADYSDPQSFHQLFTCGAIPLALNTSNFCDAGVDAAYAAEWAYAPFATRMATAASTESLLTGPSGLFPAVPLYEHRGTVLVQPWVSGFVQNPSGLVDFEKLAVRVH
jgi:oligopeptide transport system substrate-binding protein